MRTRMGAPWVLVVALSLSTLPVPTRAATGDITLLGQLLPDGAVNICDLWGYVDPSGIDYAIIGSWVAGIYIINVEDPANPFLANSVIGNGHNGFDVKVWDHYVYTCRGDAGPTTSRVYDIANIMSPVPSTPFQGHHTFHIHPDGFLYGAYPSLHAYDIRTTPMAPAPLWNRPPAVDGHDTLPVGNRLYDFHGYSDTYIWDITDRLNPVLASTISDPDIVYNHSGAPSPGGNILYICDELALNPSPDVTVWDISNLASPARINSFGDPGSTIHNICVIGGFMFASHYSAGFRVYDVSNPAAPALLDTYDTAPSWTGENYEGCYGVYAFAESGVIYVTDFDNGLFLFRVEGFEPPATGVGDGASPARARITGNFPNPFNPSTRVRFELGARADVDLAVFDATGRRVRDLARANFPAGHHDVSWNGSGNRGERVASGVYFARLTVNGTTDTHRMVLIK